MSQELKPCPFHEDKRPIFIYVGEGPCSIAECEEDYHDGDPGSVQCDCGASGPTDYSFDGVINAWNIRTDAALQASHEELVKALEAMINERYSELDMMCCEYPRGSTEAVAWEAGVRQAWKLWDLSKQPGRDALANAAKLAPTK